VKEYVTREGVAFLQEMFPEGDEWRGVLNAVQAVLQNPKRSIGSIVDAMRRRGLITGEPHVPPEPPREVA